MNKLFGCVVVDFAKKFYFLFRVNVCSRVVYVQESYRDLVHYTASESYSTCCNTIILCWDTCTKARWESIYQSYPWKNFSLSFRSFWIKSSQKENILWQNSLHFQQGSFLNYGCYPNGKIHMLNYEKAIDECAKRSALGWHKAFCCSSLLLCFYL